MKIRDIFESFDEILQRNIQDVIMMFKSNDVSKTAIENIIIELKNRDFNPTREEVEEVITKLGYTVGSDDIIKIADEDEGDTSSEAIPVDATDIDDEYDPAKAKAKSALRKRM